MFGVVLFCLQLDSYSFVLVHAVKAQTLVREPDSIRQRLNGKSSG